MKISTVPPAGNGFVPYAFDHGLFDADRRRPCLETARLRLHRWDSDDVMPFVHLCQNPAVMRFFNGLKSPIDCFDEIERQEQCFERFGYGIWAVTLKESGAWIGAIGIEPTMMRSKGMVARMSWKLAPEHWGKGYAHEAGAAVIDYARNTLQVRDVVALVDASNERALRLAARLGISSEYKALQTNS